MRDKSDEGPTQGSPIKKPCDSTAARVRVSPIVEIRVQASEFDGMCYVHVREYILGDDNDYHATQKGVAAPIERLSQLLDAVKELRAAGETDGVVATLALGSRRAIRLSISSWKGTRKADMRVFMTVDGAEEMVATKKGIRCNLALLAEIERGLELLERGMSQ